MKRVPRVVAALALAGVLIGPALLAQPAQAQTFGSNWTGLYFNNPTFSGPPAITRIDPQINFNFGTNSPAPGFVGNTNYSISWSAVQTFAAGTYRFTAVADDGVRVRIDGTTIIDALTPTGAIQTINVEVAVAEGPRTINVDFVQDTGIAVIQFFWVPVSTQPPGPTATPAPPTQTPLPPIPPGALRATVIRASVLNVRDAPSLGGNRIDRILRGQTYQVVGRNENATWFLLQLAGKQGWAWGYYLFIDGNEFNAPVVSGLSVLGLPPGVTDTGVLAVTRAGLRLRAAPTVESAQIGRVDWGAFVPVVGRTPANDWYQIVWKGTVGWVAAGFLQIRQGSLDAVPIR
jgi:uncharacterized protein YraI